MQSYASNEELNTLITLCLKLETFVIYILGAKPTKQQLQIIRAYDRGEKRIAVKSGHGTGKTTLLSWITLYIGLTHDDAKIPITAPSSPQLLKTFMPEVRKWANKLPTIFRQSIEILADEVKFANGNFAVARTARRDNPEALQGFHATNLCFILDEGSGVPDEIFIVADSALTGEYNRIITMGNPTRTSGWFYDAFNKDSELWSCFTLNAEKSENVASEVIERRKKQYGYDSDIYRVRVLGEFPRASADALFSVESLSEAVKRFEAIGGAEIWGVDVARYGDDRTVIAKRNGYKVRSLIERRNLSTIEVAELVVSHYRSAEIKPVAIYVDTIGVGAGVFDALVRSKLPVREAAASRKSIEASILNKRAEMYIRFSEKIEHMLLPDDDELIGELGAIRYIIDTKGNRKLEGKEEMKKSFGRSPDKADALALTFFDDLSILDGNQSGFADFYDSWSYNDSFW